MFSVIKIIFEFLIFFSSKSLLSVAARWLWRRQATEKFGSASTVYLRLKHAGVNHVEISFLVFYTTISSTRACGGWTELYRIWPWDRMRMLAFLNTRGMTNNRIRDSAPETEKRTTKKKEREECRITEGKIGRKEFEFQRSEPRTKPCSIPSIEYVWIPARCRAVSTKEK